MTPHPVPILSFVLLLLAALATKPASAATIGFEPTDLTIDLGTLASVDIVVSDLGGEIVSAYDLDILYDSTIVTVIDVVFATSLGDELLFEVLNDFVLSTPGVVDLAQLSLLSDEGLSALQGGDSVVLASILFEAIGVGSSALDFVLDDVNDIKGRLGEILPIVPTGGLIRVEGSEQAIPEPSAATLFLIGLAISASSLRHRRERALSRKSARRRGPQGTVLAAIPRLALPVLLLAASLGAAPVHAQVCTAAIVGVGSQSEVDNFACSEVTGLLFISDHGNGDITDLTGLSILTTVGGDLAIQDAAALVSLTGLENLTSVGGNVEIGDRLFGGNPALVSLTGLEGLASIGGDLIVLDNAALVSLTGLENLTSVGGNVKIGDDPFAIDPLLSGGGNPALVSLTGLSGLAVLDGSLTIKNNATLTSLAGLENLVSIGLHFAINDNASLASMSGLESLTFVDGQFSITDNPSLTSLAGLENLSSVGAANDGGLIISANPALASLTGLAALTTVGGGLSVRDTESLVSLAGLENLTSVGGLNLQSNDALVSLAGLDNLTDIRSLGVSGNQALTSLAGAENVTSLGNLVVALNNALPSLAGLENLASLSSLRIELNDTLASLEALENITSLDGNLLIDVNPALVSLAGLENITSVGSFLQIFGNDGLESLAGLDGVTSVGNALFVSFNPALQSLAGLENLVSVGNDLGVFFNDALVDCACGLTGLVSGSPPAFTGVAGQVEIFNNESGGLCTSPSVVLAVPLSSCTTPDPPPVVCDLDGDGDVDRNDVQVIFDSRGEQASGPNDPRDVNGDGIISVNDGRECVLECTLPNCEPACGLIGIEPFLLLGYLLWRRQRPSSLSGE